MPKIPDSLEESLLKAKDMIESVDDVKIYAYSDCDGICSAAILSTILDRLEIPNEIEFLSYRKMKKINIENKLAIFADFGSGYDIEGTATMYSKILILDHHNPIRKSDYKSFLTKDFLEINSNFYGIDGRISISGGGLCYLLAKKFGFTDLSWIAIVAAIGDMQDLIHGNLKGINKLILEESVKDGYIKVKKGIYTQNKQTEPLYLSLACFGDFKLDITDNIEKSKEFLEKNNINYEENDRYRTFGDLNDEEINTLRTGLIKMISKELAPKYIKYASKLIDANSYELLNEEKHTFLRDANELAFTINICSLKDKNYDSLQILKGDRGESLEIIKETKKEAIANMYYLINKIHDNNEIVQLDNIQYFYDEEIRIESIGTLTGKAIAFGDWKKPMLGITSTNSDTLKVSLRCSRLLSFKGIDFSRIIKKVANKVGGYGGGHHLASGAYIPKDKLEEFLKVFDQYLKPIL